MQKIFRNIIVYCGLVQANLKIGKDDVVFVYGSGCLYAVASIDGEVIWKKELTSEGFEPL